MTTGVLAEYKHQGRSVAIPYKGPLEPGEYDQVMEYYKWLWGLLRKGGLASYSFRIADTRWHMSCSCSRIKNVFDSHEEATRFFNRYSKPKIFLASDPEYAVAMRGEISRNDGPPHNVETVAKDNGLVNNRMYYYSQLDGTSQKGARVHTWWPGHVYFDYRKFMAENKNWTMECSAKREEAMNRKNKPRHRKGTF